MNAPVESAGPAFSAVREIHRRNSTPDAIFQVILHLTMGFIVIAGLKPPAIDAKQANALRLQQQLQSAISRGQEARGFVAEIINQYGAEHISRRDVLDLIARTGKRLRDAESRAVAELVDEFTPENGPLPTAALLDEMSDGYVKSLREPDPKAREKAAQWVGDQRRRRIEELDAAMARLVASRTGIDDPSYLFPATRSRIRERAEAFLKASLEREYPQLAGRTAARQELGWADLEAADAAPTAPASFVRQVRGHLPPAAPLELPEDCDVAVINEEFAKLCATMRQKDSTFVEQVNRIAGASFLKPADFWDQDLNRLLRERIRQAAGIERETGLGPASRARLDQVVREAIGRELPLRQKEIGEKVAAVQWGHLKGVPAVAYDDHTDRNRVRRIEAIREQLGPAAGLPAGKPALAAVAGGFEAATHQRASALFEEQLAGVLQKVEAEIRGYGKALEAKILDGSDQAASVALVDAEQATGLLKGRFWGDRQIAHPYPGRGGALSHELLLDKQIHDAITAAVASVVKGPPVGDPATDDNLRALLDPIGLGEAAAKPAVLDQLARKLFEKRRRASKSGEWGKGLAAKIQAECRREATKLYDRRIEQLWSAHYDRAEALMKKLVAELPPDAWKGKTDEQISKEILEKVLTELRLTGTPGRKPQ
jgi:hypothetical protein